MKAIIDFGDGCSADEDTLDAVEIAIFEAIKTNLPEDLQRTSVIKEILSSCVTRLEAKQVML